MFGYKFQFPGVAIAHFPPSADAIALLPTVLDDETIQCLLIEQAQHLPRDLVRHSSGSKELTQQADLACREPLGVQL